MSIGDTFCSNRYKIKDIIFTSKHGSEYIVGDIGGNNYYVKLREFNDDVLGPEMSLTVRCIGNDYRTLDKSAKAKLVRDLFYFLLYGWEE